MSFPLGLLLGLAFWARPAAAFFGGDGGSSGARFLRLPGSARAAAMGDAVWAAGDGAVSLHYNPAGLAVLDRREFAASHEERLGTMRYDALWYAHPLSEKTGTAGISLTALTHDRVARVDNTGRETGGSFSPSDLALGFGWARRWGSWSGGAGVKAIRQSLDDASAAGAALDLGALWSAPRLAAGVSLLNAGPGLRFRSQAEALPLSVRLSGAFRPSEAALLTADVDTVRDERPDLRLGAEWSAPAGNAARVALRGGFHTAPLSGLGAGSAFSIGLGLSFSRWGVDFAFLPQGALGDSFRADLRFRL